MSTGRPLTYKVEPEEEDIARIQDDELREIIEFIFNTSKEQDKPRNLMEKVLIVLCKCMKKFNC